jgi:prepilin-type N-terminal cleavage/methylation domain-containing protein
MNTQKKGFTLIELLIVIGILAVLATVVVLVLNPAQLFAQARDSRRVEDLNNVRSAINFYLTTVTSPDMAAVGNCTDESSSNYWGTVSGATENFSDTVTQASSSAMTVAGDGWVPVDFTDISGGSPLAVLPSDPLNPDTAAQSYTYTCNNTAKTFELNAQMESTRYASSGTDDVESTDGGDQVSVYEVGNEPGLDL